MNPGAWPSSLFTEAPHWRWLIVTYFFVGGLAGGSYFLAVLIDLLGRREDRPVARLGYYVAFPAVVVSGLLLTIDLGRPLRFWHMLVESNTWQPMLKPYSPMSVGAWALLLFGVFTLLAFLSSLAESGRLRWSWPRIVRPPHALGVAIALIGGALGFFVAGYTGVLLAVTNRPIWSDTPLLGLVFLISSASTSAALLILLAWRRRRTVGAVQALERFDAALLALEMFALVALVASLGTMVQAWLNVWGALLVVGVILVGLLLPLMLHWSPRAMGPELSTALGALLVLVGGFVLRVVIVLSSEGVSWPG